MTSTETRPTWSERLNPRNWALVWKLVVVGLVPALLALGLGVLRIADQAGAAGELGRSTRLLEVRDQVAGAADAVRQERDESTLFVGGNRLGDRGVLDAGYAQTDTEVAEMLTALRSATELDPSTSVAVDAAQAGLDQLPSLRTDVTDKPKVALIQIRNRYTQAVESLDVLDRALLRQLRTPGTAGLTDALSAVQAVTAQLALQHTLIGNAIRATQLQPNDANEVNATNVQIFAQYRDYQVALTPAQLVGFGSFLDDPATGRRQQLVNAVLSTPAGQPITTTPADWDAAYDDSRAAADRTARMLRDELVATSTAAEDRARNLAGINSVILMLGLFIGILIAILVARSLVRSLRVLRTSALDVAERRLPRAVESVRSGETPDVTVEPVPISTRDEVGQVARAFDAVHGQAVRLAADQAVLQSNVSAMFVNLSRRSQALVERQLQLIEQLESNEQDADQLSNLFQLDHLATRMRRNSENLLVLAGTDLAKRNVAPVPMVDVLRAAVSEIEQYQRIVVQAPPTAAILGRAASDLVHLLAELLDNATNFSPPDSQVVMSTTRTHDGSIVVEIADRGVGMIDDELSDANQRLGGPSTVDVSVSRRMGLFVVGRLGARHGIGVRLSTSAEGGIASGLTASVAVPTYLVPTSAPALPRRDSASVPAQGRSAPAAPPQRATDGRRPLSALVAGTDGTAANPTGAFDAPDGTLFGSPPGPGINGSGHGLPTRRPGSSIGPDGLRRPPAPGPRPGADDAGPPADREPADREPGDREPGDRDSAGLAAQAAADQEAAARAAEQRRLRDDEPPAPEPPRNGTPPAPSGERRPLPRGHLSSPRPELPDLPPLPSRPTSNGVGSRDFGPDRASPLGVNGADTNRAGTRATGSHVLGSGPEAALDDSAPVVDRPGPTPADDDFDDVRATVSDEPRIAERRPADESVARDEFRPAPTTPMPVVGARGDVQPDLAQGDPGQEDLAPGDDGVDPDERIVSGRDDLDRPDLDHAVADGDVLDDSDLFNGQDRADPGRRDADGMDRADRADQELPGYQGFDQSLPAPHHPGSGGFADPNQPVPFGSAVAQPSGRPISDELFAPSMPVIQRPDERPPLVDPRGEGSGFDRGETTPIFEEIASAWFRSNRPLPVEYEDPVPSSGPVPGPVPQGPAHQASVPPVPLPPAPAQEPLRPAAPRPAAQRPLPQRPLPQRPLPQSPVPHVVLPPAPLPPRPLPPRPTPAAARPLPPVPFTAPPETVREPARDADFVSVADEGWRVANDSIAADASDELTSAGLPKRRPRARLIPGSAGSAVLAAPVSPTRSAENIRGRLASYQQGVRQGRESRALGDGAGNYGTEPPSGDHHDEEIS